MAIQIRSPKYSFVRFGETIDDDTCSREVVNFCLPVYLYDDVAFQFVAVCDTVEEANLLSGADDLMEIGLVSDCGDEPMDLMFNQVPDRFRISEKEVLYNWPHGLPGFDGVYSVNECFRIKVVITIGYSETTSCSNCFERIGEDCYTSVLDYGATENQFDFNYCGSGGMFEDGENGDVCVEPTIIPFTNVSTLNIAYTNTLKSKYGDVPTVEIWILDNGVYARPVVRAGFDAYPPTAIIADLGGNATGFIKIS